MQNVFNLPSEDDCTLVLQPIGKRLDVMEVYDMYLDSKREAAELKREGPHPYRPVFIDKFKSTYDVDLSPTAAAMLIQAVSLQNIELKKKCLNLPTYSDIIQGLATPSTSSPSTSDFSTK